MFSFNRFRFHYEHVIRQDLLLKLNYGNIFLVPRIDKVLLISKVLHESKQVPLALEMISGQKALQIASSTSALRGSKLRSKLIGFRVERSDGRALGGHQTQAKAIVRTCLRAELMYTFCEQLVTILCFHNYTVKIQSNVIQLTIDSNMLRLFPEVQSHFEVFPNVTSVQVIIVTSAKNEQEASLLWAGLNQKEL